MDHVRIQADHRKRETLLEFEPEELAFDLAVYQGASAGLLAGVKFGLDYVRYEPHYE